MISQCGTIIKVSMLQIRLFLNLKPKMMPWAQEHWSKGIHRCTEAEEGQILLFRTAENVLGFHTKLMCEAYILESMQWDYCERSWIIWLYFFY